MMGKMATVGPDRLPLEISWVSFSYNEGVGSDSIRIAKLGMCLA